MSSISIIPSAELDEKFQRFTELILSELRKTRLQPESQIQLLSIKEAAKFLGITDTTLRDYTKRGIVKAYRIAGNIRYKAHELEAACMPIKTSY